MFSLILAFIFFIIFIISLVVGGNYFLKNVLESLVGSKEHFRNNDELNNIDKMDECKKIDMNNYNQLNFQTATNIPLSPNNYKNHVGSIYINPDANQDSHYFKSEGLDKSKYLVTKPRLLYDGIWNPDIKIDGTFEHETWKLTDGDLSAGLYGSDKLIEVNKPIPKNFKDKSAVWNNDNGGYYYTFFNDTNDDVFDNEIICFPSVFNAGITESLQEYL
jgi:hypothetical protein